MEHGERGRTKLHPWLYGFITVEALDILHTDYSPLLPTRAMKASFLDLHCEKLVAFLEAKPTKVLESLKTVVLRTFAPSR